MLCIHAYPVINSSSGMPHHLGEADCEQEGQPPQSDHNTVHVHHIIINLRVWGLPPQANLERCSM